MSRDQREGYQQLQPIEDEEQSVGAAAGCPFIPAMSSAVVVHRPLMKAGIKGLNELPDTIVKFKFCRFLDKAGYLTDSDIFALSTVSKTTHGLFQPARSQILANKLLLQVMNGDQTNAEVILKIRPDLLLTKGTATDFSGRTFNCTAFQYALWALDTRYMCQMMLDCLPISLDGEQIKQGLLRQFLEVESNGIKYQLNSITILEKHYDFTPLLTALKTFVDNYAHWSAAAMKRQWSEIIGLAQRYVPAHVAQHYCNPDEPFNPTPTFNKPKFTRILQFYNHLTNSESHWFSPIVFSEHGLGVDFGVLRGEGRAWGRPAGGGGVWRNPVESDLAALTALCKVRTKDLKPLKERLQSPIQKPKAESVSSCVIC